MNYFDDYYNDPQPRQEEPNYIPREPVSPQPPKPKKERKGMKRFVSVLLVLALVLGSCGATAFFMNSYFQKEMKNLTQQMNDKIAAVQKENGKQTSGTASRPLASGEYLTPGEVYEQNVDAVVAITVQIEDVDNYGRPVTGLSSGTGFFITSDGYVVTNYHVIEGAVQIAITTPKGEYGIEVYACAGGYMWELCKAYETDTFSGGTTIYVCDDVANPKLNDAGRYDSYEEALLEGIKQAIKILKGK